jgi:hypothetical protein
MSSIQHDFDGFLETETFEEYWLELEPCCHREQFLLVIGPVSLFFAGEKDFSKWGRPGRVKPQLLKDMLPVRLEAGTVKPEVRVPRGSQRKGAWTAWAVNPNEVLYF